jgi:hypothetical protein
MSGTLGQRIRDTATGIEGIVVQRTEYIGGHIEVCIAVPATTKPEEFWIAESRAEVVADTPSIGFSAPTEPG